MWNLTIINNYREAITGFDMVINKNDKGRVPHALGNGYINVVGVGTINFTDIGEQHVGGFSTATWGVLISYQGEELVFRYEGGGEIQVTINQFGQAEITGNGGFSRVPLSSFVLPGERSGISLVNE